jgi:hypothetical protein
VPPEFLELLDGRTWKRHPKPFSKTKRGEARRSERHFARAMKGTQP